MINGHDVVNNFIKEIKNNNNISNYYLDNLEMIYRLSVRYSLLVSKLIKYSNITPNNELLCNSDILILSKEYLNMVSNNYPDMLDKLYNNEQVSFTFEKSKSSSTDFDYFKRKTMINIKREGNYLDVLQMVHEFMHYTNYNTANIYDKTRRDLTEFVSIYHELMTSIFLIKKYNIRPNKINEKNRLINTFECSYDVISSFLPILVGLNNEINDNSNLFLNKEYNIKINKNTFDDSVFSLLNIKYKLKNNDDFINYFNETCSYILCTYLAFYSLYNSSSEDIDYLNDNLNRINITPEKLLSDINIKIDNDFENKALSNIKKYTKKYILGK